MDMRRNRKFPTTAKNQTLVSIQNVKNMNKILPDVSWSFGPSE
jgi:hypothetical protein